MRQSSEADEEKRKAVVWEIDEGCRRTPPGRSFTTGSRDVLAPEVKGLGTMVNSLFNGWRFEDVWLDR